MKMQGSAIGSVNRSSSVKRQKGEPQNECFKTAKHSKSSEKRERYMLNCAYVNSNEKMTKLILVMPWEIGDIRMSILLC